MKRYSLIRLAIAVTTVLLTLPAMTLGQAHYPLPMPRTGYWVVESQPKQKCVVHFYNDANQLIYQEVTTRKRLNIQRTAIREKLNTVLDQALSQWVFKPQGDGPLLPNQQWLAAEFKKRSEK